MLTQERLKQLLVYDPDTGVWRWLIAPNHSIKVGQIAGSIRQDGYRQIRVDCLYYFSVPLACFYMTGKWPLEYMDHINWDRGDDRWVNLREATACDNMAHRRIRSNNTSGYLGVSWDNTQNKWDARVNSVHIGWFDDLDEAVAARDTWAVHLQGSFAVLNTPTMEITP
jgi:hypothetical protein